MGACWPSFIMARLVPYILRGASMRGVRLFILLLCVAAVVAFSQTGSNPSAPPSGARSADANAGKTTDQAYKNIQVLKGFPADELIPAMQYFNASLGVDCNYCHEIGRAHV